MVTSDSILSTSEFETKGVLSRTLTTRDLLLGGLFAVIAILPYLDVVAAFRSDDVLLIAQGNENSPLGGLLRSMMRPFGDTRSIEFYRPFFTWNFCIESHCFGDRPGSYQLVNFCLQALCSFLAYLFSVRLLGRRAAIFATFLFVLSPWTANNMGWIAGRCTVVATIAMLGVGLLHDRARRLGMALSRAAFVLAFVGVFYRETAFLAPLFALALDVTAGRKLTSSLKPICLYTLPFLIYLVAKKLVLGTVLGGYTSLAVIRGAEGGLFSFSALDFGRAFVRLIGAAPEPFDSTFDNVSLVILALASLAFLFALAKNGWRQPVFWLLTIFALGHGLLLCMADAVVQVGTAQRWHSVVWALTALLGCGLAKMPRAWMSWGLVVIIATLQTHRLRLHLDDYDSSARLSRELAKSINDSVEKQVFIYNLKPYVGAAPFFEIGAGQFALPPFGSGQKSVYPIVLFNAYGADPRISQTPIAAQLLDRGELASVFWIDYESGQVFDFPPSKLRESLAALEEIPRLVMSEPKSEVVVAGSKNRLAFAAVGIERVEIHLVCPVVEIRLSRVRGTERFPQEAETFSEDLEEILSMASHMIRGSKSRAWLWVVAYAANDKERNPMAVSSFIEVELHQERR